MASFANRQNGKTSISTKSQSPFTSCRLSLHIDTIQTPTVHVTNLYKQQGLENKISADGVTSMEMEIKLLNVARSSIKEAREDFEDYLTAHQLAKWSPGHARYNGMLDFCRKHNKWEEYERYVNKWNDEEMANVGLTLCHMIDKMMITYQNKLEKEFVSEGGIKERMTAARLGFRTNQKDEIDRLKAEIQQLKKENDILKNTNLNL